MPGIIDVHSHPLVPTYRKVVEAEDAYASMLPPWSIEEHLAVMDRNGIAVCILSLPDALSTAHGAGAKMLARTLNTELAEIVAAHPTRFGAFAAVPMDDMDAAIEESAYALDVLGLDGVSAATHHAGRYLGEDVYDPWFAEMDRRGSSLFVHPAVPPGFSATESRFNVSVVEFMFDTTRMIANMVLSGKKARYAAVNVIATHGGGTIPFLSRRIGMVSQMPWAYRDGAKLSMEETMSSLRSFYLDLTASTSSPSLGAILPFAGTGRLLTGFDFPLMPAATIAPASEALGNAAVLENADKAAIARGNALRLFPRFA